ncbi:hypothetical protein FA95DRAFT_1585108 [Auriscalpium vulgare]|uniref:Uncharacterized protein n=1 Tax=Auriscalpium vulgare TaxID=40419 RepID=A0ACB8R8P9_9AGAM|nr:hypothetical protein FA95DRAFT_1585108 [Auriscalpium vulgare]
MGSGDGDVDDSFPPQPNPTLREDVIREFQAFIDDRRWVYKACAVCGQKRFPHELTRTELKDNDDIPHHMEPVSYDFEFSGMYSTNELADLDICGTCSSALSSNYQYYGHERLPTDIRSMFERATAHELQLVSYICPAAKGGHPGALQRFTKGNVAIIPQDVAEMTKLLPPTAADLQYSMCVMFIGGQEPTIETIKKFHPVLVSKNRVEKMAKFLLANNKNYVDLGMQYSAANLTDLCDTPYFSGDMGITKAVEIQHIARRQDVAAATNSSYAEHGTAPTYSSEDLLMETVGYTSANESATTRSEEKSRALEWCLDHKPYLSVRGGTTLFPDRDPRMLSFVFPHLDPYGHQAISFERQLRNLLLRFDAPFAQDANFAYVGWNIIQKADNSAAVQFSIKEKTSEALVEEIIKSADVFRQMNANTRQEKRAISLRGSNGYKLRLRNEIRALLKTHGCPALYLLHVLAGGNAADFPLLSALERARQVADNPAAASVLRYGDKRPGLFGHCEAYYGTVEAQGRGYYSPQAVRQRLEGDATFQDRVFTWLESIVHCHLPGMVHALDGDPSFILKPAYTTNLDPRALDGPTLTDEMTDGERLAFEHNFSLFVRDLAIACNWHEHRDTCFKYLKPGEPRDSAHCRMRITGEVRSITELDPDTSAILLKRLHPWINNYNDVVMFLLKCSGEAAKALVHYVTDYITKASLATHLGLEAICAVIEKAGIGQAGKSDSPEYVKTKSLMIKIVNAIMARQELSHPQVMSYLVGGGDHYTSHMFRPLMWGPLDRYIRQQSPGSGDAVFDEDDTVDDEVGGPESDKEDERVVLTVRKKSVVATSFLLDYRLRGEGMSDLSAWDHCAAVERLTKGKEQARLDHLEWEDKSSKASPRVPFLNDTHPLFSTHLSRLRTSKFVPVVLGPTLPRSDRTSEERELWCRAMLILFKPWRCLGDLKDPQQQWSDAFALHEFPEHLKKGTSWIHWSAHRLCNMQEVVQTWNWQKD